MGKIMHGGQAYSGGGGTTVIANPSGTSSADLNKVSIEGVIYNIPSGGGGGGSVTDVKVDNVSVVDQNGVAKINTMTGAGSGQAGAKGLVPAPASGDNEKYLKGDGTWGTPSGGGGSSTLAGLTDVDLETTPPTDGQILIYDDTNDKWVNDDLDITDVEANPQETATATLTKLKVGNTVYDIPQGGGNGGASEKITIVKAIVDRPTENVTIEEQ